MTTEPSTGCLSREDSRVLELDGLRGLAILLVLVWHYFGFTYAPEPGTLIGYAHMLARMTWSGVDLFFVLSGYLISTNLLATRERSGYFRVFYVRRAARILPLYLVVLGVHAIVAAPEANATFGHGSDAFAPPTSYWPFLTFTQNIAMAIQQRFADAGLSVTWSLAVEEQFYLLLPMTIWLLPRRVVPWLGAGCVVTALLVRITAFCEFGGSAALPCYVLLPTRCDSLFLGVIVGSLFSARHWREQAIRWQNCLRLALVFLGLGMLWMTFTARGVIMSPFMTTVGYTWNALFYAVLLAVVLVRRQAFLNRILCMPWLCRLGVLSFGVYLFHEGLANAIRAALADYGFLLPTLFALLATLILAECSWRWLESPLIAWARRLRFDEPLSRAPVLTAAVREL